MSAVFSFVRKSVFLAKSSPGLSPETTHHQPRPLRKSPPKKFEKGIWIANSTAVIFCAFWTICILQDILVWILGNALGIRLSLSFDRIFSTEKTIWNHTQVLILFGFIPLYYLVMGIVGSMLHSSLRLKKDLRKLYFLWICYFSFSILGGSFVTSFIDRGNMRVLWEYMRFTVDYLPLAAFASAALLVFFGTVNLWKFLNVAPSSEINKDPSQRFVFILCTQVIPLLIFFGVGYVLYPNREATSRFFSSFMVWVPVLGGLTASFVRDAAFAKVPAFRESEIRKFQPAYLGLAALIYMFVLLIS